MSDETPPPAGAGGDAGGSGTPPQGAPASQPRTPMGSPAPSPAPAPAPAPAPTPAPAPEPKAGDPPPFKIPDAYKEKPWASKIKTEEDLYKQIDTLDALKGKKTVVPDFTKATPKEIEDYFAQTRPESIDAYQFADGMDDGIKKVLGESLLKNGVTAYQANAVLKAYQDAEAANMTEQYSADGMNKALETSFGAEWKEVGGATARILKENLSGEDAAMMDKLPNVFLGLVYRMANNLIKGYGIEETGAHTGAGAGKMSPNDIGASRDAIRAEITALSSKPHTAEQKQVLIDKLTATFQNDPRLTKKG